MGFGLRESDYRDVFKKKETIEPMKFRDFKPCTKTLEIIAVVVCRGQGI